MTQTTGLQVKLAKGKAEDKERPDNGLRRELGLGPAVAMVLGESIALGIFLTPAEMAKSLGSPLLVLLVWLAMALMAMAGALCYGQLALEYPRTGGGYVYLRQFYGERTAFLYGWMSLAVMDCGLSAALAVGAIAYLQSLAPALTQWPTAQAALLLVLVAACNYRGTRVGGRLMTAINFLKLSIIAVLIGWSFLGHAGSRANLAPFATRRLGAGGMGSAIAAAFLSAFFSFGGWWDANKLAGEVKEPRKLLPRALVLGVAAVAVVYVGLSMAFLYVVPLEQVSSNLAFVSQFGTALFRGLGAKVLAGCVLVSVVGGLWALMMAAPRVYYAMSVDGAFFARFGRLHPRYGTPGQAILLQLGCSLLALNIGGFDQIIAYVIFMAVIFLALTAAAVFRMEGAKQEWWYPFAPGLFIACCVMVAGMILLHSPKQAVAGCMVVGCGYPLYWVMKRGTSGGART